MKELALFCENSRSELCIPERAKKIFEQTQKITVSFVSLWIYYRAIVIVPHTSRAFLAGPSRDTLIRSKPAVLEIAMNGKSSQLLGAVLCVATILSVLIPVSAFAAGTMVVIKEIKHDVSPPLAEMVSMTPLQPNQFSPRLLNVLPTGAEPVRPLFEAPDTAVQEKVLAPVAATLGLNFEGLGLGQYGFALQAAPPDTEGVIGLNQYVQWVNLEFAVFDKATGALVAGPHFGNTMWAGFGGVCQTSNDGDPIVQYDKIANRWIFTQFAVDSTPYTQCIAVSTTSDATGTYNRYAFTFGINFNDYPKMGIWPDAYYMSFNMFRNGSVFIGPDACALDRNAMLAGQAATIICFQQGAANNTLLPSDMDGTIQPAAGEPAFFVDFGTNSLKLWKFHVDFATPANSTFTGPTALSVANFTQGCNRSCVAQPNTTNKLDMLGDRMMYRLAYRKFADGHESLVTNHSITTGLRWYEIRDPNGTPTIFQQGTLANDSNTRWMGSIGMDQAGNIGLGYTLGSATVFPSVFMTGRVPSDPLGSMETEQVVVNGSGSQTSPTRWGDYSDMSIDPVDDCTFWYTQEYSKTTGTFSWNTRIVNFKFPTCSSGPNFTLSASPNSLTVAEGSNGMSTITVTPLNGFSGNVTLSATGLPNGVTAGFSPNPTGSSSTLTLTASQTAQTGTSSITIKGVSGSITQTTNLSLTVTGNGPVVTLVPTSLTWGKRLVGSPATKTVTLTNTGSSTLNISSLTVAPTDFTFKVVAKSCKATVAPGASCFIKVTFSPTQVGLRTGAVTITDNAADNPQTIPLQGTGK